MSCCGRSGGDELINLTEQTRHSNEIDLQLKNDRSIYVSTHRLLLLGNSLSLSLFEFSPSPSPSYTHGITCTFIPMHAGEYVDVSLLLKQMKIMGYNGFSRE